MGLRVLLHNIKFLFRVRFEDMYWTNIEYVKTGIKYGRLLNPDSANELRVLDSKETLELLLDAPKSFYRFGDGEILIMKGGAAGTQEHNPILAQKLLQALTDCEVNAYIGIGREYFDFDLWGSNHYANRFYMMNSEIYRSFFRDNCSSEYTYIDTGFSQRYFSLKESEIEAWFDKVKLLFKDKSITLFMGEKAYNNLSYYIFDLAKRVDLIKCPSRNAFDEYDTMMEKAISLPKTELICLAVGATAKVMAYELTKKGYVVYDIGHMPKDYDSYMKKITRDDKFAEQFYLEDYSL